MFKQTLNTLPEFIPYDIQYDIQFPRLAQKTLTSYVTFITPHLPVIQARAAQNPFAGSSVSGSATSDNTKNDVTDTTIIAKKSKTKTN